MPRSTGFVLTEPVQGLLRSAGARSRRDRSDGPGAQNPRSLLRGKLKDETGDRLTPSHAVKSGRRIRYYVSRRLLSPGGKNTGGGWRLPAAALETAVTDLIANHIDEHIRKRALALQPVASEQHALTDHATAFASTLRSDPADLLPSVVRSVTIAPGCLSVTLDPTIIAGHLGLPEGDLAPTLLRTETTFQTKRRGVETRIAAGAQEPARDTTLVRTLTQAHRWVERMRSGDSMSTIAAAEGLTDSAVAARAPLAFLSPRIQKSILAGTLPVEVTLERILATGVPLDWNVQARRLGLSDLHAIP